MNKAIWLVIIAMVFVSGCTANFSDRILKLEERMETAESQIKSCETRLDSCESNIYVLSERQSAIEAKSAPSAAASAANMSAENIQSALKNAGFYNGPIDGKIGPNTEKAIIEFQKANNLKADGVVGAKTTTLLMKYLSQTQSAD